MYVSQQRNINEKKWGKYLRVTDENQTKSKQKTSKNYLEM